MKIRTKLILVVISIVMPIMVGVTWLLLNRTEEFVHNQIDQHQNDHLLFIDTQLQNTTDNIKRATNVLGNRTSIQKILHLGTSLGISQTLNRIMKIYPYFNYILIVDKHGEVYAANTRNADGKKIDGESLLGLNIKHDLVNEGLFNNNVSFGVPRQDPYSSVLDAPSTLSQLFSAPVFKGGHLIGWVLVSYDWHNQINLLIQQTKRRLQQFNEPITEILLLDHEQRIMQAGKAEASGRLLKMTGSP